MFCIAVREMIEKTMPLHYYQLDGKVYRQSSYGSIGLDLNVVMSDIYMCDWVEEDDEDKRGWLLDQAL